MSTAPASAEPTEGYPGVDPHRSPLVYDAVEFLRQRDEFIARVFVEGVHYGSATGEEKKDDERRGAKPRRQKRDLLLPGAQALLLFLNARDVPEESCTEFHNGHIEWKVRVRLVQNGTDCEIGTGLGTATTLEKKHRWRYDDPECPECQAKAIRKSTYKEEYYCNRKAGGCGKNFAIDDTRITEQPSGKSEQDGDVAAVPPPLLRPEHQVVRSTLRDGDTGHAAGGELAEHVVGCLTGPQRELIGTSPQTGERWPH